MFKLIEFQMRRLEEESFYLILLAFLTFITACGATVAALNLERNFHVIACDTAAYQNTLANLLYGNFFRETAYEGPNLLGLHASFILLLIAPIYSLFPSAEFLFILQVFGIYGCVIPSYLIAVRSLKHPVIAFLIGAYVLLSPLLLRMSVAPFHPESWIIMFVLWSVFFYQKNKQVSFWISMALALSCAEQASLLYIGLGLALLFTKDDTEKRLTYAYRILGASIGWLLFTELIVIPIMHQPGQLNLIAYNYSDWGCDSGFGLILAITEQPIVAFEHLCSPYRWAYILELVGPPLALALYDRRSLLLLFPFAIYFLMTSQEYFLPIHAYYFQFAFFAGIFGFIFFMNEWGASRIGVLIYSFSIFWNIINCAILLGIITSISDQSDRPLNNALREVFRGIPLRDGVYSPHRYSAYLSNHYNMVMGDLDYSDNDFENILEKQYLLNGVHSFQIKFIICDLQEDQCNYRGPVFDVKRAHQRSENVQNLLKSGMWEVYWTQDHSNIFVLKRK